MTFGEALVQLKAGHRVVRAHWKNVTAIFLVDGSTFQVNRAPLDKFFPVGTDVTYNPHIDMLGADGTVGVWTPSNGDVLAEDWSTVE